MTLDELQSNVDNWIKTYGVRYFNELTNLAILMEETGELARLMARKYGEQSFKADENNADLADELADILFVISSIANQTGVNLSSALTKNLLKKTNRDNSRHFENKKLQ